MVKKSKIAREYRRKITALEREQEKLYQAAIRELGIDDASSRGFDYLFNGFQTKEFEAWLDAQM